MSLFSRYVFRQVANAFVIILVTLTTIVWLATALKQLDLIVSQGQGFVLFLKMTFLTLPSLMALIAPNAILMASLYTLDRMNGDSELIVMTAAGAPVWRIGAPFVLLASMVCVVILICNLWVMPASMRALRALITQVRTDVISQVLQPGRFSSTEPGLTFHIRDRSPTGDLLGLLVHDERDDKQLMSYLADRGRIISNDDGAYLVMFDGHVHRYEKKSPDQGVQIVAFDQYIFNISDLNPKDAGSKELRPRERYLSELLNPDPKLLKAKGAVGSATHRTPRPILDPLLSAAVRRPRRRHIGACPHHPGKPLGANSPGRRNRRGPESFRAHRLQFGHPERGSNTSRLSYSNCGDSRCGPYGAR